MQEEFILFGSQHIITLSTILTVSVAAPAIIRSVNHDELIKFVSIALGIFSLDLTIIKSLDNPQVVPETGVTSKQ